jgi:hypothetical protein
MKESDGQKIFDPKCIVLVSFEFENMFIFTPIKLSHLVKCMYCIIKFSRKCLKAVDVRMIFPKQVISRVYLKILTSWKKAVIRFGVDNQTS